MLPLAPNTYFGARSAWMSLMFEGKLWVWENYSFTYICLGATYVFLPLLVNVLKGINNSLWNSAHMLSMLFANMWPEVFSFLISSCGGTTYAILLLLLIVLRIMSGMFQKCAVMLWMLSIYVWYGCFILLRFSVLPFHNISRGVITPPNYRRLVMFIFMCNNYILLYNVSHEIFKDLVIH